MLDTWKKRPMSWSQIASWEFSPQQWHNKYILGEAQADTAALLFGKEIGERLATDPTFLPEVPRLPIFEQKLTGRIGDIELVGYLDNFCPDTFAFNEFKTSGNKTKWTQKTAQKHGQLLFYKFLIYLNYGVDPSKVVCKLVYIPVEESGDFSVKLSEKPVEVFDTQHTVLDILNFAVYIKKTRKEMIDYCKDKSIM